MTRSLSRSDDISSGISEKSNKVLGVPWNFVIDKISVSGISMSQSLSSVTKRDVVSAAAKIFDPFGLLLPVTIKLKLFIQNLWKEKISWDQSLTQNKLLEWNKLINDVSNLKPFCIDRKLYNFVSPDFHIFADSSMNALGAVAYLVEKTM